MFPSDEFQKYAVKHRGITSTALNGYVNASMTPYIIEERQLNVAQMDVFSRLMMDRSLAMETLTRLSMAGFSLSIDDFGTGYSSLVQLIDLPFRELKIDAGFVQRAVTERKAQAVLRIAILLGQQLDMGVVAEGVETPEQLAFVQRCGCEAVQGFLFARPMAFDACTAWLHNLPAS